MFHSQLDLDIDVITHEILVGGAERLVVDAALGLQRLGHSVDIYTSHHDPSHCFDETRDGALLLPVILEHSLLNICWK